MYSNDSSASGESIRDRQRQLESALVALGELIARGQLPRELDALAHLAPRPGSKPRVVLHHGATADPTQVGRDIKDDAGAHHWSPTPGHVVRLWYEGASRQDSQQSSLVREAPAPSNPSLIGAPASPELRDLVLELDRAERGKPYVVLTYFRDTWLVSSRLPWVGAKDDPVAVSVRQRVLSEAIDRGLVTTSRVPNPKRPGNEATAIALQRTHASVAEILADVRQLPEFQPVPVRGEPLSEMILRERRQR